MKTAEL
jgi:class 3 adenylate cyclase